MRILVSLASPLIAAWCQAERVLDAQKAFALPVIARLLFLVTLLDFFIKSALTKFGDGALGFLTPSAGAFAQIFPKRAEAVLYNTSEIGIFEWVIIMLGTYGELILPILIVVGLATRLASLAMIGFILVMSIVDVAGHGVALGALLDGNPGSIVPDQRLFWCMPLLVLVFMGAGRLSLDQMLFAPKRR
ncbi:MAG: DoxX family protein [Proteobacteria bacterium]|nr:DoxX family protein [Pseudomonadota bacterium]